MMKPSKKCPRCYRNTLKRVIQTDLEGGEKEFEVCSNASCGFERQVIIQSSTPMAVLEKFDIVKNGDTY